MKPFAVGLIGSAVVGLLLRDANGTVAAYFVIGIAAGWVGRGWMGPAWLVGGTVTAWLALGLVEALGIAGTMWGTATAPPGEEATLLVGLTVVLAVILVIQVLGYGVGVATIRLARRWGLS